MAAYESTTVRLDPSKTCVLIEDLLPLYMEGEVSPGSRDMIVEHLAICERCAGFLAGAQSVRAHLRRGQYQPAQASAAGPGSAAAAPVGRKDRPIVMLFAMLGACLLTSIGMVFLTHSGDEFAIMAGFALAVGGFVMLCLLGSSVGRWNIVRLLALISTYVAGCIAAVVISNAPPPISLGGAVLGIGVLFALWHVLRSGSASLTPAPKLGLKLNPQLLVLGGLGIGGMIVLLALPAMHFSFQAPVATLLLLLAGLVWWKKQQPE